MDNSHKEPTVGQAPDDPGRDESEPEREDRNLMELLQELRVAGLGVQVLFGFLLSLPFSVRFPKLDQDQRDLYVVSLTMSAFSTVLLCAPVAYHRMVFRLHLKDRLLHLANMMAVVGLAAVAIAISAVVVLVVSFIERGVLVVLVSAFIVLSFAGLWFALPLNSRFQSRDRKRATSV
jgi:hypothetical protein